MSEFVSSESEVSETSTSSSSSKKSFRVNTTQLFFTYSQCDKTPEQILEFIKSKVGVKNYIVAQEQHKDGGKHIHAYILLEKKINCRDCKYFDFDGFHPSFEGCRSWTKVVKYVTKDGKYITNYDQETINKLISQNTKSGEIHLQARNLARDGKWKEGLELLENPKTARDLSMHGDAIERNLRSLKKQKTEPRYSLDLFKVNFEWDRTKTLVLWGPTNTGKTSLAKALLPNALFVRHKDALKEYKCGEYEGIIFDDMSFKHWPREAQIHLLDTDNVSQIDVKHSIAIIPEGTPRIITTNMMPGEILSLNVMDPESCALTRRIQQVWIEGKVF